MSKQVEYQGMILHPKSQAYFLWEMWQTEKQDKPAAKKKLDAHLREVEQRYQELIRK